jgi:acetyl-CoA carboxylase carboxyltransferase component
VDPAGVDALAAPADPAGTLRDDLQRLLERNAFTLDASRPEAMSKRHAQGLRSARENVADLCDPGSFSEIGEFVVSSRPQDAERTPADGIVTAGGRVLSITAQGESLAQARNRAYTAIDRISIEGARHRTDIAREAALAD